MRKLKYIMIALAVTMCVTGCKLDETIYGTISDNDYWKTEEHIREGINSAYGRLNTRYNGFSIWQFVIEDGGSDCVSASNPYSDFFNYANWSSTNPTEINWGLYKFFWNEISYLNKTLDKIPGADMPDDRKEYYTCEARTLRAFIYFTLVQWFNGVPLVTSSEDIRYNIPKSSPKDIYDFIEKEITESMSGLPTKEEFSSGGATDYGRLTRGAAAGILARVYLVQEKYDLCRDICEKIINDKETYGNYSLMPVYKEVISTTGFNNSEIMWALAGDGVNNGMMLQVYLYKLWDIDGDPMGRDTSYDVYAKWNGNIHMTYSFYQTFDPVDRRAQTCLQYNSLCNPDRVMVLKYPAVTHNFEMSATDYPVVRYADILLMYAESLLLGSSQDVAGAVYWVNEVRKRAGVTLHDPSNFSTAESFSRSIYNERRWELFMEGCAKRDMLRFGTLRTHILNSSVDAGTNPERYYYLPFPATALTANPGLIQNPGYIN